MAAEAIASSIDVTQAKSPTISSINSNKGKSSLNLLDLRARPKQFLLNIVQIILMNDTIPYYKYYGILRWLITYSC
jgi:hypothetical protein